MVIHGCSRIDLIMGIQVFGFHKVLKNPLRTGRAANITEANKQNFLQFSFPYVKSPTDYRSVTVLHATYINKPRGVLCVE